MIFVVSHQAILAIDGLQQSFRNKPPRKKSNPIFLSVSMGWIQVERLHSRTHSSDETETCEITPKKRLNTFFGVGGLFGTSFGKI